jgi:predicted alpha/beta superfamily hydrolase
MEHYGIDIPIRKQYLYRRVLIGKSFGIILVIHLWLKEQNSYFKSVASFVLR